jgi:hypothetical protein
MTLVVGLETLFVLLHVTDSQHPSREDLIHHMTFHVGESKVAAAVVESEAFVVEAEVACKSWTWTLSRAVWKPECLKQRELQTKAADTAELETVRYRRLIDTLENIVLARNLSSVATPDVVQKYEAMRKLERTSLDQIAD